MNMGKLNRGGKKRSRKINTREVAPAYCLIVTEGTETEVNYFENIKDIINKNYKGRIKVQPIALRVKGIGKSTCALVKEAVKRRSLGSFSDVWVVFDKDDNIDFDDAIKLAKDEGLNVAWSNESFELWLLLHFQDLNSPLTRNYYESKLDSHFKRLNYNNGKYEKNIKNIFEVIKDNTLKAIERSEKLLNEHKCNRINICSKMNPATNVQELVNILLPYIK
jgi:hypothetical protein